MSAYCAAKAGARAVRRRAAAGGRPPRGDRGQRPPDLDRHRHGARHRGGAAHLHGDPQAAPGPLGAFTSVEACAEALVENLETRRRRVFVPRLGRRWSRRCGSWSPASLAEKVAMKVSAKRVPQLERDIAALDGREFGKNSIGAAGEVTSPPRSGARRTAEHASRSRPSHAAARADGVSATSARRPASGRRRRPSPAPGPTRVGRVDAGDDLGDPGQAERQRDHPQGLGRVAAHRGGLDDPVAELDPPVLGGPTGRCPPTTGPVSRSTTRRGRTVAGPTAIRCGRASGDASVAVGREVRRPLPGRCPPRRRRRARR